MIYLSTNIAHSLREDEIRASLESGGIDTIGLSREGMIALISAHEQDFEASFIHDFDCDCEEMENTLDEIIRREGWTS